MAKAPAKIDEEALAEAYNRALALEKSGDLDAAEKAYAEVLALDPEDHGGASVRLAALGRGETPIKAPDAYVETLFDQHAEAFEEILVEQLGYCVPVMIRQKLQELKLGPFDSLLDLGCGTGLTGASLRDMVNGEMVGLDLSENMVEIAHEKDFYETLYVAEGVDYLDDNEDGPFALVTAADVLPYIGALEPLFFGVAENLEDNGLFVFSSETRSDAEIGPLGYKVGPSQRFVHSQSYVTDRLAATGFDIVSMTDINVRMENGQPSPGHLVVARLKSE
ncbi:class I SAM-dependent DNA methyltransferase [Rhizobium sp. C4]|uniref:class I SAM-dependent DNA methyltransferase n=1 Tax=Rhizobium sp. C4 TaxID=1349800 RepID=UPI001E2DDF3D|nr:methyltransferase domain-containing protein [Rhizobium sp. C4]MCD2171575.1 methyltransferase domain-containing protein [Rhizobium sp. C4]